MGVTRFSLEGGDVVIPLLDTLVRQITENGCREVILGMAHRGRLNVQTHILGKSYEEIFREFEEGLVDLDRPLSDFLPLFLFMQQRSGMNGAYLYCCDRRRSYLAQMSLHVKSGKMINFFKFFAAYSD